LTLQGLEGKLFQPVAHDHRLRAGQASLLLSLTVIPVVVVLPVESQRPPRARGCRGKMLKAVRAGCWPSHATPEASSYGDRRWRCWSPPASVYTQVGKTFMPTMDEGDLIVGIEKLPSIETGANRRAGPEASSRRCCTTGAGDHQHRRARRLRRDRPGSRWG
jgi:cobalt-zinc-cadmium resistance protein CzcA